MYSLPPSLPVFAHSLSLHLLLSIHASINYVVTILLDMCMYLTAIIESCVH